MNASSMNFFYKVPSTQVPIFCPVRGDCGEKTLRHIEREKSFTKYRCSWLHRTVTVCVFLLQYRRCSILYSEHCTVQLHFFASFIRERIVLHSICFIRNSRFWRLVVSYFFFQILTSFRFLFYTYIFSKF